MLVVFAFDEELEDIDIVDMPINTIDDLEEEQKEFFEWLFNKDNNHEYWIIRNGEKTTCSYDSRAFVKWFDEKKQGAEKAMIVEQYAKKKIEDMPILYF